MTYVSPRYQALPNEEETEEETQQPAQQQQQVPVTRPVMVTTPVYIPTVVQQLPKEYIPNDYLILSLVIMLGCAFLSISTLFFTVPAFICSIFARNSILRGVQFYAEAKRLAYAALILDIIAVLWLFGWGIFTLIYLLYLIYVEDIFY